MPTSEYDVFISYAHIDNHPVYGMKEGWVTQLRNYLSDRLSTKLGREALVFMDYKLTGNDPLSDQLIQAVESSSTLLMIVSPAYISSRWCARERNTFLEALRSRMSSNLFVVEYEPVAENDRPTEICRSLGYRFWCVKESRTRTFGLLDKPEQEYYQLVEDLVCDLKKELEKPKEEPHRAVVTPVSTSGSTDTDASAVDTCAPAVFLAEVTPDLYCRRQEMKRYLVQSGFPVVPDTCLPRAPEIFAEAARCDLRRSRLFVQLLSDEPENYPDLPDGYAPLQIALAEELKVPMMQWRSPDLDLSTVGDPRQIKLLNSVTVRAEGIEEFKSAVKRALSETPAPKAVPGPQRFVYIDSEPADEALAGRIRELLKSWGIGYAEPVRSPDPAENRKDLENNLLYCDVVLLLYGDTKSVWVRSRLLECNKKIRTLRETPLDALAVLEGPPAPKAPISMELPGMIRIDCSKDLGEDELKKLLQVG